MASDADLSGIRHIISINDFSREEIVGVLRLAARMEGVRDKRLEGRILASLFFEPSTRTRLSFEAAMLQLGGQVMGFADGKVSSVKKGETLHDTIRVMSRYADVIVMRHPLEGAARVAADASSVPVINGGDGANQHPTQTFLDLFTIARSHPQLLTGESELCVALLGDLRYGRTVHSLIMALAHFRVRFKLVSPPTLELPETYLDFLRERKIAFEASDRLEDVLGQVDVLYATRIQEERFPDPVEFQRVKNAYLISAESLADVKPGFKIMHPLPRVGEIDRSVDNLEACAYFDQVSHGLPVRKALLCLLLGRA